MVLICISITASEDTETTRVCFARWLNKEDMVSIYNGVLPRCKKRWNTATCDNIDESQEHYAMWSKSERKSQEQYDFTHICDIKLKATNKSDKQQLIDTGNNMLDIRVKRR